MEVKSLTRILYFSQSRTVFIGEGALFYFKVLICDNFCEFDESPGKYTSKNCQVETKLVCKKETFFMKMLVNTTELTMETSIS